MSTEVKEFENKYLQTMIQISILEKQSKDLVEQAKKVKADLEIAMDQHDIKSIDNDYIKVTRVAGSTSESIDLKQLEAEEPKLYKELLKDYTKVTNRKAHVKISVK